MYTRVVAGVQVHAVRNAIPSHDEEELQENRKDSANGVNESFCHPDRRKAEMRRAFQLLVRGQ